MLKVYFYLKSIRGQQEKESLICARLSYQQQTTALSTGKYISKERWNLTNKLRNVLKLEKEKVIRRSLDLLHLSIDKKFNEIILSGNSVSLADLKNDLKGIKTTVAISIIDILETYINYFTKKSFYFRKIKSIAPKVFTLQRFDKSVYAKPIQQDRYSLQQNFKLIYLQIRIFLKI